MDMNISGVSLIDSLASQAVSMQSGNVATQISSAVLKNILDAQKQQGEALVAMISQSPSLDGTGQLIDVLA